MNWIKNNVKTIIVAIVVAIMIMCGMSIEQISTILKFL